MEKTQQETAFTPGVWRVGFSDGSGQEEITNGTEAIATVRWGCSCCKSSAPLTDEEKANARLIAAAPALLEALELVMQHACSCDSMDLEGGVCDAQFEARAAIAQARGKS